MFAGKRFTRLYSFVDIVQCSFKGHSPLFSSPLRDPGGQGHVVSALFDFFWRPEFQSDSVNIELTVQIFITCMTFHFATFHRMIKISD